MAFFTYHNQNSFKNELTSLRLVLDELKNDQLFLSQNQVAKYLKKADQIFLKLKKRENLLRSLTSKNDENILFELFFEINQLLAVYGDLFKKHNIKVAFSSDMEYRIYAAKDVFLQVFNSILMMCVIILLKSNRHDKKLIIQFEKKVYQLKIIIRINQNFKESHVLEIKNLDSKDFSELMSVVALNFFEVNQLMNKYFHNKIQFKNKKGECIFYLKLKKSFVMGKRKNL
jgi:hypothetical protein